MQGFEHFSEDLHPVRLCSRERYDRYPETSSSCCMAHYLPRETSAALRRCVLREGLLSTMSFSSGPVPIRVTGTFVSRSIAETNSRGSFGRSEESRTPFAFGHNTSSFVRAICVAPLRCTARLARLKSKGAALLSRPVTVPCSIQPRLKTSSLSNWPSKGPSPTLVTYALKIIITSSTSVGPIPTSAHA